MRRNDGRIEILPGCAETKVEAGEAVEIVTPSTQEIIPTVSSYKREDGTMESRPLHDMYPFMDPETLRRYML